MHAHHCNAQARIWIIICYECNYYLLGTIVKDNHYNVMLCMQCAHTIGGYKYYSCAGVHLCVCTDSECSFICFCVIILNQC